jgi:tetraacyldisaccharide 4'-kinase
MTFFKPNFWDKKQISFFSIFLFPLALLIKFLALLKFLITKKHIFAIPIICVGNLYLGGTGKTPLSIEIFKILKNLKKNPVFIRKKYILHQDEVNLQKQFGEVFQSSKRVNAINNAVLSNANIAIMDDGFQDFSINKNLSILCFNEKLWIGNGFTIPSGPLRESLSSLKRANCVMINGIKNIHIEKEILKRNSKIKIFYTSYNAENINMFKGKKITAFAGIGNPESFFQLLKYNQINVFKKIKFPDHNIYSDKELEDLCNNSKSENSLLLTTEKDYFRINEKYKNKINYLKISLEIENKEQFINEIKKII